MISSEVDKYIIREFGLTNIDGCRVSKINEGLSGAKVFMLEILKPKRNRMTGVYILKIIDNASDCNQRAPTDGFAEQNGRDAERADLTYIY